MLCFVAGGLIVKLPDIFQKLLHDFTALLCIRGETGPKKLTGIQLCAYCGGICNAQKAFCQLFTASKMDMRRCFCALPKQLFYMDGEPSH